MAQKREPDLNRDIRVNVMRAVRDALRVSAGYDPEDRVQPDYDELARCIADAIYECAEELAIKAVWQHEHKAHGEE